MNLPKIEGKDPYYQDAVKQEKLNKAIANGFILKYPAKNGAVYELTLKGFMQWKLEKAMR